MREALYIWVVNTLSLNKVVLIQILCLYTLLKHTLATGLQKGRNVFEPAVTSVYICNLFISAYCLF